MANNSHPTGRPRVRRYLLVAALALVSLGLLLVQRSNDTPPAGLTRNEQRGTSAGHNLAVKRTDHSAVVPATRTAASSEPRSPQRRGRAELYPGAVVLDQREQPTGKPNEVVRTEIIQTPMKYPFLRIESRIEKNPATGAETVLAIEEIVADHVIVELAPDKTEADLRRAMAAVQGNIRSKLMLEYRDTYLIALPKPTLDAVPAAIRRLAPSDAFRFVEADGVAHRTTVPNDPRFSNQWSLRNTGQTGGSINSDIRAADLWTTQTGNDAVVIAISDTGVDYTHSDLRDNLWRHPSDVQNGVDDDANGFVDDFQGWDFAENDNDPYDDVDHGTRVAGIIGARGNNGVGVAGIAWRCKMIPIRVLDQYGGFNSDIAAGFDYARRLGVKIINASHGGGYPSELLQSAVDNLQGEGVLLVAAAGNDAIDNDAEPLYPASYANPNVISVAYTDHSDNISPYSCYGLRSVDLAAPGVQVWSTAVGNVYDTDSGSSFATPHVTGVAALLKAQNPGWTFAQIRTAILNNVDAVPSMYGKCASGGRLNALKALRGPVTIPQGVDNTTFSWRSGGSIAWSGQTIVTHDGNDAARSGEISNSQESWMETTVYGPGTFSFWWKVSCEKGTDTRFDYFQFLVNGVEKAFIDGEVDWQQKSFSLPAGTFNLRWRYRKDPYIAHGQDRAWVDQFSFTGVAPAVTVQPVTQTVEPGTLVNLTVSASGTPPLTYQWKKNDQSIPGATTSSLVFNNVQTTNAGSYSVVVNNPYGTATSASANLTVCSYTLQPASATFGPGAGGGQVAVTVSSGCSWNVTNSVDWITIDSGASGDGDGTISYSVTENSSESPRTGSFRVGNKTFSIWQYGQLPPVSAAGHTFSMTITNGSGDFAQSGGFLLSLLGHTNLFRKIALGGTTTNSSGNYSYARANSTSATLSLSNDFGVVDGTLTFSTPVSGSFHFSDESGEQGGTFAVSPTQVDLNMDGLTDLLWQHTNGSLAVWYLNGTNVTASSLLRNGKSAGLGWRAAVFADINRDGQNDILLQHNNGKIAVWHMDGVDVSSAGFMRDGVAATPGWRLAGANDFDGDGKADLLFQHDTGLLAVWRMDGTSFLGAVVLRNGQAAGVGWRVVGLLDFNGDGQKDILWQHNNGLLAVWHMIGTQFVNAIVLRNGQPIAAGWRGVGFTDANQDGYIDVLFLHTTGKVAVWYMKDGVVLKTGLLRNGVPAGPGWNVISPWNVVR